MIENKDYAVPAWNDISVDGFDASEKEAECDTEDSEDEFERDRAATIEDEIWKCELFEF